LSKSNFSASIVLLLVLVLLTGCSKMTGPGVQQKVDLQAGGQLTYGTLYEPDTLNPLMSDLVTVAEVSSLIFSGLLKTNNKGEWIPDLAAEAPNRQNGGISANGLTLTYHLRNNVTWHDGTPLTADDVRFTWRMIMDTKVNIKNREGYDKIQSVEAPDKYTVVIHFREYYPGMLSLFPAILPQHILSKEPDINKAPFNRQPVGTGPFRLKDWHVGEAIVLEAYPQYFRGKPALDGITYRFVPDPTLLVAQLKTGEFDIFSRIPFAQLDQVRSTANMKVVMTPNLTWEHAVFNLNSALFQDVRVRKAVAMGIDRSALVAGTLKGAGEPALADQPSSSWAYNSALQMPARDVAGAKELLQQAGWKLGEDTIFVQNGRRLAFVMSIPAGNKAREAVARLMVQQLKEIGVEMEVKAVQREAFLNDILKSRNFDMALFALTMGTDPDNYDLWNSKKIPSSSNGYDGRNIAGWVNPEIDELTLRGRSVVDQEVRKQAYWRMQELIVSECPVIPLYFWANIDMVKNTVANYQPNPTGYDDLWNAWQWAFIKQR